MASRESIKLAEGILNDVVDDLAEWIDARKAVATEKGHAVVLDVISDLDHEDGWTSVYFRMYSGTVIN